MNEYNVLKERIEAFLNNLSIKYEVIDLDDNDLNYDVEFIPSQKLKVVGRIDGILYFHHDDFSMNLLVANIYKFSKEDDLSFYYELINNINMQLPYGNFLILTNKSQIIYRGNVNCGKDYNLLEQSLIEEQFEAFINALQILLKCILEKKNNEQK